MKSVLLSLLIVAAGLAADATKDRFRPQQRRYWAFQKVTRPNPGSGWSAADA